MKVISKLIKLLFNYTVAGQSFAKFYFPNFFLIHFPFPPLPQTTLHFSYPFTPHYSSLPNPSFLLTSPTTLISHNFPSLIFSLFSYFSFPNFALLPLLPFPHFTKFFLLNFPLSSLPQPTRPSPSLPLHISSHFPILNFLSHYFPCLSYFPFPHFTLIFSHFPFFYSHISP